MGLGFNGIGDAGAQCLATALLTNTTLTSMDLSANHIGAAGAQALATALLTNTTLTSMNLVYNSIGDAAAQADLFRFLARNKGRWENQHWAPAHHLDFPPLCHTMIVVSLLCGRKNALDVPNLPMHILQLICSLFFFFLFPIHMYKYICVCIILPKPKGGGGIHIPIRDHVPPPQASPPTTLATPSPRETGGN